MPTLRVGSGWDRATAHRARRDVRRVGSQPSLRWSRRARPAVVERVPMRPGGPGLGPGHRSSSLSRCPQGRLPACVAVVSTGSTAAVVERVPRLRMGSGWGMSAGSAPSPRCGGLDRLDRRWSSGCLGCGWAPAGAGSPLIEPVEMSAGSGPSPRCGGLDRLDRRWSSGCLCGRVGRGWDRVTAHRACRDVRRVGSQPSLRWSRQARPAVVVRVPMRPGGPGLGSGRRSSSPSRCPQGRVPALRCGGLDRLDRRWSSGCLRCGWAPAGTGSPLIEPVEMSAGSGPSPRCGGLDRLDRRWSVPARVATAGEMSAGVGSQPLLGWSRRARPAVVGSGAPLAV